MKEAFPLVFFHDSLAEMHYWKLQEQIDVISKCLSGYVADW
jgi:hypothetical protein